MYRTMAVASCLGAAVLLPLPAVAAWIGSPAWALWTLPIMGAALGTTLAVWQSERRQWTDRLNHATERWQRSAAEAADLQGLELSLLADLEESEAELEAHQSVAHSLAVAIQHTLTTVEQRLPEHQMPHIARQIEEALELVADARDFTRPSCDQAQPATVGVFAVVDTTLMKVRAEQLQNLTWSIGERVPDQASGSADRLEKILVAAARAAARLTDQPHLDVDLVDHGDSRGLRLSWTTDENRPETLPSTLGSRLANTLAQPALVSAQLHSLTWWMHEQDDVPAVVGPTLPAAHVLLASRQPRARARVRRLLERWGLTVITARSGNEALVRLDAQPFDIVLLDLAEETMPTLEHIRELSHTADTPVLLLAPEVENVVWLGTKEQTGFVRSVGQDSLLDSVEAALQERPEPARQQSQHSQYCPRVLVVEPNPAVAATLIRAGADAGCEVVIVATDVRLRQEAQRSWDLVLVGRHAMDPATAIANLHALDPNVPRLLVGPTVDAVTRNVARAYGLTDAAIRPSDAQGLLTLVSLAMPRSSQEEPSYSMLSATASKRRS
ncbi:MAG: hypothetical protein AB8H79_11865 [Myxococcota bacterium]